MIFGKWSRFYDDAFERCDLDQLGRRLKKGRKCDTGGWEDCCICWIGQGWVVAEPV
jgi:hypothetical protein